MNIERIFERLPSHRLLQSEWIDSLNRTSTIHFLRIFGLEDSAEEDSDDDDLHAMLFAYISSLGQGTDMFHRLFELSMVFPGLDFELVESLLDSTDGKVSKEMINEFIELNAEVEENQRGSGVSALSVSRLLDTGFTMSDIHTIDRKNVLIITDDDEDSSIEEGKISNISSNRRFVVLGVAMGSTYGLNALYSVQESFHTKRCRYMEWGLHDLHVCCQEGRGEGHGGEEVSSLSILTKPVYITSVVFEYTHCLERTFDLLHYSWGLKGESEREPWTPALEAAMLNLLVAVDDDLVMLVRSWKSMMAAFETGGGMGGGMTSDLENMLQMVQADATEALRTHSANAIGRLHQVLSQFAEMSIGPMAAMINIPPPFLHAIEQFILTKLQASFSSYNLFVASLTDLVAAGKKYSHHLKNINHNVTKIKVLDDFIALYEAKIPIILDFTAVTAEESTLVDAFFVALTSSDVKALESLKPSQLDSMLTSSSSHYDTDAMCYLPALSLKDVADPNALTRAVTSLAEKSFNDAITIGTAGEVGMGGYTMTPSNRSMTCAMLSSLLNAGVAYVATKETAKLMGHLPMWRSTLSLQLKESHMGDYQRYLNDLPSQLKKRIKDMKRIFRNKIKKKLSFRLNFDISNAVSLLREHHGVECWVGHEMEQVWHLMAATSPPQLMIFELYYGDTLVAADFAHPICGGRAVYVATRFSARGHSKTAETTLTTSGQVPDEDSDEAAIRTMQPGFILALVECRWLQLRGCELWDLGGYNLSPLMQYKLDLAGQPKARPHGLYEFRRSLVRKGTCGDIGHPWISSEGADVEVEVEETAVGCNAANVPSEALLCSNVMSGDVLIDDVRIGHLLGHSSAI